MELSEFRKKSDNFGKSLIVPGIPAGNFRDRRFPGIPVWEFPVALLWCGGIAFTPFCLFV